jgi:Holliday junction DNA helicase RuvA
MFNSIYGKITEKHTMRVFIRTGGIEWDIGMPSTDADTLPPAGGECRIWTWLSHREDAMTLYGFSSEQRRATFLELLKVDGIGPKAALKILGGIGQTELERALETGDVARLEAVPGLGKKTAQKMILALKGKIVHATEKNAADSPFNDLADALSEMGYEKRAALSALEKAAGEVDAALAGAEKENAVFRRAILHLSGQ